MCTKSQSKVRPYHFETAVEAQSAMHVHVRLEGIPRAVERVGGVWDVEVRILLARVQEREIGRERAIRAPELAVRVHRFAAMGTEMLLVELGPVRPLKPCEHRPHLRFGTFCDQSCNREERLVRVELWPRRERAADDTPLVVLAYLNRDTLKNLWNTSPAVEDDRLDDVPEVLQRLPQDSVLQLRLMPQLRDVQVLVRVRVSCNKDAVLSAEVRGVDDQNHRTWTMCLLRQLRSVQELRDRWIRPMLIVTELVLCTFLAHERFPQSQCSSFLPPRTRR